MDFPKPVNPGQAFKRDFLKPAQKHHKKCRDSSNHINAIDDNAYLHPGMLDMRSGVGEDCEDSAKNHKGSIAGNHNLSRRRLKSPGKAPQGQYGPWNKNHQGTNRCK